MSKLQNLGGYELLGPLRRGSMGEVFKARDPQTGKLVVIKLLAPDLLVDESAVERFKREIRASLQLEHPGLIQAYTAGQDADGGWYYVMEHIEGATVKRDLLHGAYEEDRALEITRQVAEALDYAWGFSLIHRDIKPENIMLTADGRAKLGDLGLAKSLDSQTDLTMMGAVIGTPHYMSPEQARGEDQDFRSDIYSLGATLYQMVTTYPPFEGDDPLAVITKLLSEEPPSPRDHNPRLSDGICYVIGKMLSRRPEQRYGSYRALIEDLKRAMHDRRTMAEESGQIRILTRTAARDYQYRFCHVPGDQDLLFGKIALRNRMIHAQEIGRALDLQEEAARHGALVALSDLMVAHELLGAQQVVRICRARCQYEIERSRELFLKAALENGFVSARQVAECRKFQKVLGRDLVPIMIERGAVGPKELRLIGCYQKMVRRQEEDRQFVEVAIENRFITQRQAQKCLVIQNNGIVMGQYRDLGGIMVEKELLQPSHKRVILRAVRRNQLTGQSISDLIRSLQVEDGADKQAS